jgi:hypothetical protein
MVRWRGTAASELERLEGSIFAAAILKFHKHNVPQIKSFRQGRRLGDTLLTRVNSQWDRAISSFAVRTTLGFSFGVIFSVLLFKRRTWPVWLGTGFGAGRAWEEADGMFPTEPTSKDMLNMAYSEFQAGRSTSKHGWS